MEQSNGVQRFGQILVSKLKDKCELVKQLIAKAEEGRELTHEEQEILISWLPALGKLGEAELHAILANLKSYDKDHLQKQIDSWKNRTDRFITCREVKDCGLCKNECLLLNDLGEAATPVFLFIDKQILNGTFDSIKQHEDYIILTAKGNLTFKITNFYLSNGNVQAKVELIMGNELIYSDLLNLSSGKSRKQFANRSVEMRAHQGIVTIDLERCLMAMEDIVKRRIQNSPRATDNKNKPPEMTPQDKEEARAVLMETNPLKVVKADAHALGYVGEDSNIDLVYLICTSRKLPKPMACIIRASSSAGKNALAGVILDLMPDEEKLVLSRVTTNALFYCAKLGIEHKVICIAERSGSEEADYSIRTLISECILKNFVPMKNEETGMIETRLIEVQGPVAYIETTTQQKLNIENLTRLFSLFVNESEPQTALIHEAQRREKTLSGLSASIEREKIHRKHQNAQRLLESVSIVIPFATLITFPTYSVRSRRDHEKFLSLIMTVAFLRQYQKTKKYINDVAYVEADMTDYEIAFELSKAVLHQTMDEISKKSRDLMVTIRDMVHWWHEEGTAEYYDKDAGKEATSIVFTRADVRKFAKGWSDASVHACMKELGYYELLRVVQGGKQGLTNKYTILNDEECVSQTFSKLTTPEELRNKLEAVSLQEPSEKSQQP